MSVAMGVAHRSEEHTSELQSLRHLVCRLLLEKNAHSCRAAGAARRDRPAVIAGAPNRTARVPGRPSSTKRSGSCGGTSCCPCLVFFFNDTATTEIYTLSLHDALPIWEMFGKRVWIAVLFVVTTMGASA